MTFVFLSVLCSVLVSVLLKLARRFGVDIGQAVSWNYVATSVLTALIFKPDTAVLQGPGVPWIALVGLGLLLPSIFIALGASVRHAGIVRSDAAQRLSLLISLLAAFLLFGEQPGALKGAGIAVGLVALLCMVWKPSGVPGDRDAGAWAWPLAVFVGFGLIDILFKQVALGGVPFAATLQGSFALAWVVATALAVARALRRQTRLSLRDAGAGLLLGLINFGNIVFYVKGHQALPQQPALVFAGMNLGVVALGALVGVVAFRERLTRVNTLGLLLALVAIALIARASWQ